MAECTDENGYTPASSVNISGTEALRALRSAIDEALKCKATGEAKEAIPVIKVKAVTHRINPIWRTTVGPGEEHVNMAGIPTEASILDMVERAMPGKLLNVFAHSAGGGRGFHRRESKTRPAGNFWPASTVGAWYGARAGLGRT